jgi:hypothetical protein
MRKRLKFNGGKTMRKAASILINAIALLHFYIAWFEIFA